MDNQNFKTKVAVSARVKIEDFYIDLKGEAVLSWSFALVSTSNFIDGVYVRVPDQNLTVIGTEDDIHPSSGMDLGLIGKEFKLELRDAAVDLEGIKLGEVIQPTDIFFIGDSVRVSFSGEA